MTTRSLFAFVCIFSFCTLAIADDEYPDAPDKPTTLTELEEMALQKSWGELQLRLDEIPPADRGTRWESLVEKAAVGRLAEADALAEGAADTLALDLESKFPLLLKKQGYLENRSQIALKAFDRCYARYGMTEECTERIVTFATAPPRSPEFAWKGAQLIAKRSKTASDAMPLMQLAMTEETKKTICASEPFSRAALAALETGKVPDRAIATEMIQSKCWASVQPAFEKALRKDRNPAFLDTACPIAKGKGTPPTSCQGHFGEAAASKRR
jgi:hypothetical protein